MPYKPAEDIAKYAKRISESGECRLTGKRAEEFFRNTADIFGLNLGQAYEEIKKIPKVKVTISDLLREMRAGKYEDIS